MMVTTISQNRLSSQSMNRYLHLAAAWLMLALFQACGVSGDDYSEFRRLPENGWLYGDSVIFTPQIEDSTAVGKLIVAVRHNNSYAYRNLWLEVTRHDASGKQHIDTVNMQLCDRYGRWHGRGFGAEYQHADTLSGFTRVIKDSSIVVRHVMRVDKLADIEQIGVTFVATENK